VSDADGTASTSPAVSVVIPTFDRGETLARTLEALAHVDPPRRGFETIVVDDGSNEPHAGRVAAAAARIPNCRLIRRRNAGPASARNLGWRIGSSELVAFLDDDCAPAADWLVRLVATFDQDDSVAAAGGRVLSAPAGNWVGRFCTAIEYATGVQPVFENAATANACYRRRVLEALDGFDESFRYPGGDDPDLSARARAAGYRLVFVPDAIVYHAEIESYRDFLDHMYKRGIGEAQLGRKLGRQWRVALRAILLPVFLYRTSRLAWRTTAGKGPTVLRLVWLGLEALGRVAFVAGSVRGLVSRS
jgi:GT2 family glycosyltransferase